MGNLKITYILVFFTMERILAACNKGLGIDANSRKIPDSSITASSEAPYYSAKFGRLNERYSSEDRNFGGWCSYDCSKSKVEHLQVDLGKAETVTAVATQPVFYANKWVTSYGLSYSYDGMKWMNRKVAGKGQVFKGNKHRYEDGVKSQVDPPITARFIRIIPLNSSEGCPCMRAELYGCTPKEDCSTAVGIDANKREIPNTAMTSSSEYFKHFAYEGRLHNIHRKTGDVRSWGAWCAMKSDKSPYLQIDLGRVRVVSGVATQGYSYNLWTTQYRLNYSMDGILWKEYMEQGVVKLFIGNSDNNTIRTHILALKATGRFIRFIPVRWNNYPNDMPCLRVEIYECAPIKGSVPTITKGLIDRVLKRGSSFNLTCIITGQPLIEATWLKNGKSLSTTDMMSIRASVRGETSETSLDFKNVKMNEDGNRYSCAANYPGVDVQAVSTAQITIVGTIPVLKVLETGEDFVEIFLGLKGPIMTDITAFEVLIVDFSTSKELVTRFPYQSNMMPQKIFGLDPLSRYDINVRLIYLKNSKGTRIPNQQFRTLQCKPKNSPVSLSIKTADRDFLEIHWQPPVNDFCKGAVVGYDVRVIRYEITEGSHHTTTNSTKANTFLLSPLQPGNKYNLTVRAKTTAGPGPFSTSSITFTSVAVTTVSTTRLTTIKTTRKIPTTEKPKIKISDELVKIKQIDVNDKNALNITKRVEKLTNNSILLNKKDISITADILEEVVNVNGTDPKIGESLVKTVSNILGANSTVLEESYKENKTGVRYVKILENWLEKVKVDEEDISESTPNIIVKKIRIIKKKIKKNIVFKEKDGTTVIVPVEVLEPLESKNKTKKTNESIYFVYYKKNSFFGGRGSKVSTFCEDGYTVEEKVVYTPVLASSIVGREVRNLSRPITLRFRERISRKNIEKTACVYWDFNAKGGMGDWSAEGCKLYKIVNKTIICHCDHMTNFAAMMDVYAHTSKACGSHGKALSYISVIGCFFSLIGLFFTILTYTIFRRLRREIAARIMLQLCFSLFVVVILFLTGLERTKEPKVCLVIGAALHYFTLVAFMWMFMEAVFMYHAFVVVWPPREDNDVLKCTLAAWGLPCIVVAAILASDIDHYRGKHYCRVHGMPFYFGFLAPICLILISNLVIFAIIMYKLSSRPSRSMEQRETSEAMQRLKRAFGIMILMGLTWLFGAFAVSDARLVFQYLFAVCNSLQGFAIFLFYCLSQKNVRDAWRAFVTCDTRSELKKTTDSYYERRRLSSASQKTNTLLPRTRTNSSTVMMRHDSAASRMQDVQTILNEQIKMQTIEELDMEDRYIDQITSNPDKSPFSQRNVEKPLAIHVEPNISVSSAEDVANKLGSQAPLKPYHSYRALSDIKELNDLLSLAERRKSSSKSNEMLVRKSLFIAGSSPLLQPKEVMRPAKSCEAVNKQKKRPTEMIDFGTLRVKKSAERCRSRSDAKHEAHPLIDITCSSSGNTGSIEMTKSAEALQLLDQSFACDNGVGSTIDSTYKNRHENCFNTLDSQRKENFFDTMESDDKTIVPKADHRNSNESDKGIVLGNDCGTCNGTIVPTVEKALGKVTNDIAPCKVATNGKDAPSDLIVPDLFSSYHNNALQQYPVGTTSSHDNIVRWLHDTTTADDILTDSSDEYRSSMCSSLNDINNAPSCRSSVCSMTSSQQDEKRRTNITDSPLGRLVVGPLCGTANDIEDQSIEPYHSKATASRVCKMDSLSPSEVPTVESSALYSSVHSADSEEERRSEDGYSASEEEGNARDRRVMTRNRRRTKSRSGSVGQSNGYVRSAYV